MVTKTVAIYTFFDGLLKSMNYKEEKNRKVSDSEVITAVLPAGLSEVWRGNEQRITWQNRSPCRPKHIQTCYVQLGRTPLFFLLYL
jgi:hypothetical protein